MVLGDPQRAVQQLPSPSTSAGFEAGRSISRVLGTLNSAQNHPNEAGRLYQRLIGVKQCPISALVLLPAPKTTLLASSEQTEIPVSLFKNDAGTLIAKLLVYNTYN